MLFAFLLCFFVLFSSGSIQSYDEDSDPEMMKFIRGSFGLLGIVYEVTFKVSPLRLMKLYHKVSCTALAI